MHSVVKSFQHRQDGNIAVIFGLALIPLLLCTGVAVDYSRASSARAEMQSALDAATLAVAQDAKTLTAAQLQASINSKFNAALKRSDIAHVTVNAEYANATLRSSAAATVSNSFLTLGGIDHTNIGVSSESVFATGKLDVTRPLPNVGRAICRPRVFLNADG